VVARKQKGEIMADVIVQKQMGPILATFQASPASPMYRTQRHVAMDIFLKNTSTNVFTISSKCIVNAYVTADFASPPATPLINVNCVWSKYPLIPPDGTAPQVITIQPGQTLSYTYIMWYLKTNANTLIPFGQYQLHGLFNSEEIGTIPMLLLKPRYS
jgi:hypothetical protein